MEVKELTQESMIKTTSNYTKRKWQLLYKRSKNRQTTNSKSPNEHGNTLGNQPAERYKLVDRKNRKTF
ncbi:hypothetical protein BSPWISOXPB_354 [uncultured Gammaproteobacteria bacterium]|nr:hypothetical protein BSPWISOXPB_354 [uncultured Gammaproteobacteria bacterium]